MADFGGFQTSNVAAGAQGPQQIRIGDLINQARGMQQYQKEAELYASDVAQSKAMSEQQQLALQQKQLAISGSALTGLENSAALQSGNIQAIKGELESTEKWLNTMGVPTAKSGVMEQAKQLLAQGDIKGYQNFLGNLRKQLVSSSEQFAAMQPQLTTIAGQPALYTPSTGQITQPQIQGQQGAPMGPQGAPAMQGGAQQGMAQAPAQGMELPYKPRQAGDIRPFGPTEQLDTQQGQEYRNRVVGRAAEIPQAQYNVRKVIEQAKDLEKEYGRLAESTATGQAVRTLAGWKGDTRFKELSKDLAIAQLSNMKALGMDMNTDKGRELQAAANGDVTFPPSVLVKVARRVEAENLNIQMQAQAAQKFATRHGDANMKAFQEAWAKNSSPEVFQAMNGVQGATKGQDVNAIIAKTLGLPADTTKWSAEDKTKASEFRTQYRNIQRLTNTGSL